MEKQKVLITTAIDYVNDVIHIGHAYQKILADAIARYYRLDPNNEVFFLTGTDEHGSKSEEAASNKGVTPKEFVDEISSKDKEQLDALQISYDRFIRTTDEDHYAVVKDFYERVYNNGNDDIYLGEYKGIYCIGCEEFKKEKDLVDGKCPNHPTKEISLVTEENYFFAWTHYAKFLTDWITSHPDFVQHEARRSEMLSFLEQGLEDIPISRTTVRFGIPVPTDPKHVLYVWFDALINYVTGAPDYWQDPEAKIIHILGKDNVRWHALLWPAMLKAAGFRLPSLVYGHDFYTLNGQKISKSLGNIIRPTDLVDKFGSDAVRYFFLRYGPIRDDVDVTLDRIKEVYNADLANGLGNLVARVAKMAEKTSENFEVAEELRVPGELVTPMEHLRTDLALEFVWKAIKKLDQFIDHHRIWELADDEKREKLSYLVAQLTVISYWLKPFIPETADKVAKQFSAGIVKSQNALFPRIN